MTKYRIRLAGGRVIGPFLKDQLFELKSKGHIHGNVEAQVFPTGSWLPIASFDFYGELMDENKTAVTAASPKEETFVIDLTKLRSQAFEREIDALDPEEAVPVEELTETVRLVPPQTEESRPAKVGEKTSGAREAFEAEAEKISDGVDEGEDGEKTVINSVAQREIEKLRQKMKSEEEDQKKREAKKAEDEKRRSEAEALAQQLREEEKDESTRVLNLATVKNDLLQVAREEEIQIEKAAKEIKKRKQDEEEDGDDEDVDEEDGNGERKKKTKKLLVGLSLLALAYVLLSPDKGVEKATFKYLPPQVEFPLPFDKADSKISEVNYTKGLQLFNKGGYPNIIKAGTLFKTSYENNLENSLALNFMVRAYAEELRFSKEKLADAQVVFNVIQSKRPTLMLDPNGVIGLNLFYMAINKPEAAVDVTAKYLKLSPKNVTPDLFATYLKSLMKVGKLDVARQFFIPLEKAPEKNRYVYEALLDYYLLNQEMAKAEEHLDDALKKNPGLVQFQLMKAELLMKQGKLVEMEKFLSKAEALGLENNDVYRAKFLELSGLSLAAKGQVEKATVILANSLKLEDSNELRMKLADLSSTNGSLGATDKLIAESKAIKLLNEARDFFEKKNYELALSTVARATDAYEGHIPSELFLAKVQLKLGQAEQALKTLEALAHKYPENKAINFGLIEAYIDTYKFNDAKNRISIVAGLDIKNTWEFASLNARLYSRMGDSLQAINFLKMSIGMNPLNDADIFRLAEVFIKRANFEGARMLLNKAMELDPINPDYRIAYSKVIYETQDDQAAIGYLLGLSSEFGENPKFLGEIAIFYFRAGKVKDFMAYKEKLQKLPGKDKALYEFLIKSALLDERYDEIPVLVEQLVQIEPGDLESMMTAGRVLFENGKLAQAAVWFKRVQEKLTTYPKVQYYIAKIKLLAGEIDDPKDADGKPKLDEKGKPVLGAIGLVQKDIKENGENDVSLVLLAEIYLKKEDIIEAENLFKRAQKLNPRSYEALVGLADISTKRNNFDLALDLYKRAMNLKSDEPILHKKVGDVYRLLGQGALAMESYKMYLEMAPEAPDKGQVETYINIMK